MGEQLVDEILTPAQISLISTEICEGQQPCVDINQVLNTLISCKDPQTKIMLGKYLKREVQILEKTPKANLDWVSRLVNESLDTQDEYLAQLFVETAYYLPYKPLSHILKELNREISNIFSVKGKSRAYKLVWMDVFFKAYLKSACHDENSGFQTGNALDLIRTTISSCIREFRSAFEHTIVGNTTKDEAGVVPMDMVLKFNNYLDYYFAGRLPDEHQDMTQDQKDIIKPLVSVLAEQVWDNLDQLLRGSRVLDDLLALEVFVLICGALRFRQDVLQVEQVVHSGPALTELSEKAHVVYSVLSQRMLLSADASAGFVCLQQVRSALKCCYRVNRLA